MIKSIFSPNMLGMKSQPLGTDMLQIESGQIMIDKMRGWKALNLVCFVNSGERAQFFYSVVRVQRRNDFLLRLYRASQTLSAVLCSQQVYGDKDLWQMSYWRTTASYRVMPHYPGLIGGEWLKESDDDNSGGGGGCTASREVNVSEFCGASLAQYDENGNMMFIHSTFAQRTRDHFYDRR